MLKAALCPNLVVPPSVSTPQVGDSDKKAAEYLRHAAQSAASFAQECKALGIDGAWSRPAHATLG